MITPFLAWFWYRCVQLGRKHRVCGAELVTSAQLRRRIQPLRQWLLERRPGKGRDRAYRLAGIPFPPRSETHPP